MGHLSDRGSNPLSSTKNKKTLLGLFVFYIIRRSRTGAAVNGAPVAPQSRDPARQQAGDSPQLHHQRTIIPAGLPSFFACSIMTGLYFSCYACVKMIYFAYQQISLVSAERQLI